MNNLRQAHVISAIKALSHARLRNYRTFFGAADDRAAYGLYCWNEAVSSALGRILSFAEIAIRNQFHVAISGRYGVGASGSRDWYNHLALNKKSLDSVKKITHEWRIVAGTKQQIPRTPVLSPDDVISKLTFGFWRVAPSGRPAGSSQFVDWFLGQAEESGHAVRAGRFLQGPA